MSEALYERYKDALRRGHVASLRGRLDVALGAYVEAATLAPERALPHTSIGGVYLRLDRPADALVAFDAALERALGDEAALRGRADALAGLERRAEAASALDRLAATVEAGGRPAEALEIACGSLELAESRTRRRTVRHLAAIVRAAGDPAAAATLDRATHLLETEPAAAPTTAGRSAGDVGPRAAPEPQPAELAPEPVPEPPRPDPVALAEAAAAVLAAGDRDAARAGLLEAAGRFAEIGADDAALDACYQALTLAPADPECHLALAERYLERGWTRAAADKLVLLDRLAGLAGDGPTAERARVLARARMASEPRAATLVD